jgi:hypothetical protein
MNTAIKISVYSFFYSFWFAFIIWVSLWLTVPFTWVMSQLEVVGGRVGCILIIFLWGISICLLAIAPIWWIKKIGLDIAQKTARNIVFVILLLGCMVLCTIFWSNFVDGKLYNCTDAVGFDFLQPGNWIHGAYVTVTKINPADPMNMPDSVKQGWSVPKLWLLWWSFVVASVVASASLASLLFWWRKPID